MLATKSSSCCFCTFFTKDNTRTRRSSHSFLLREFDMVGELEDLVESSPSEHVRRYAAGALFNVVETLRREVVANAGHRVRRDSAARARAESSAGSSASQRVRASSSSSQRSAASTTRRRIASFAPA